MPDTLSMSLTCRSPQPLIVLFFAGVALVSCLVPDAASARNWRLAEVARGLDTAVAMTHAGDDRLFVVAKEGRVWIYRGGQLQGAPFLDIRGRVLYTGEAESEQGLLSIAFHPDYAANGYFFAAYTRNDGAGVVSRFSVSGPDPDAASAGSERVLLVVPQPGPNHNLNHLTFGPDGHLYISSGDGGYQPEPRCTPQEGDNLLGKILRLDVDSQPNTAPYFRIPADNPFLGDATVRDEIWSLGLRNPWRFGFDSATGDLWITDVGHRLREEVSFVPAGQSGGQNWGFKMMEGFACRGSSANCDGPIPPCFDAAYTPPVLDYGHDDRHCAVIGGFVYRGSAIPEMWGSYIAGDYCGATFLVERQGNSFRREELSTDLPDLLAFGEDSAGEPYALASGTIYRIEALREDATLAFTAPSFEVDETAGQAVISVERKGGTDGAASVSWRAEPATAGEADFAPLTGSFFWAAGEGGARQGTVPIFDDGELEGNERIQLVLFDPSGAELGEPAVAEIVIRDDEVGTGGCQPSDGVLCLDEGRFQVTAVWRDFDGETGIGHAVPLDTLSPNLQESGLLWFFTDDNMEVLIKVLDACPINQRHWVFLSAATDVEYTLRVLDTVSGELRQYGNSLGEASRATGDVDAFPCV